MHEHPLDDSFWKENCVENVLDKCEAASVSADQCQYGFVSKDQLGVGLVRRATGLMTNSMCLAQELQRTFPDRSGRVHHRHVVLQGGETKAAQVYLDGFCQTICQGQIKQMQADQQGQFLLDNLKRHPRKRRTSSNK